MQATGMVENKIAGKKGGGIALKARRETWRSWWWSESEGLMLIRMNG
jgi:hypothetical protein